LKSTKLDSSYTGDDVEIVSMVVNSQVNMVVFFLCSQYYSRFTLLIETSVFCNKNIPEKKCIIII